MLAKKPHKLTRGATNKTKREDPKQGKQWGKTQIVLSALEPKIIFGKDTPSTPCGKLYCVRVLCALFNT